MAGERVSSMEALKGVHAQLSSLVAIQTTDEDRDHSIAVTQVTATVALVLAVQELTDAVTPPPRRQIGWIHPAVALAVEPYRRVHDHDFSGTAAGHEDCQPVWVAGSTPPARRYQPAKGPKWTEGQLLGFDIETTSADPFTAIPVSYALVLRREVGRMSVESNLVDPGIEIPAESTEIHGITTERARSEGMPLDDALARIFAKLVWANEEHIPLVAMNASYDLTVIDRLVGLEGWSGLVLDPYVLDKAVDKYRKGSRKLGALVETYGVEVPDDLGGAHSAASDAAGAILVLLAMAERYEWLRRREMASLHKSQVRWHLEQQESLSDYFVRQGDDPIPEYRWDWPIQRQPEEAA